MMKTWILGALMLSVAGNIVADSGKTPVIAEMFTSKFCPNCPMAERKLEAAANENTDLLVIFEHVDYWDRKNNVDPYGLPDITQRQYDYSNTLMKRAGAVYTPMPVLDGQIAVGNPLMFTWSSALEKGRALPEKPRLAVKKDKDGSLDVVVPANLYSANREVWVLGVEPVEASKAWRVRGMAQGELKSGGARIAAPNLPKTDSFVVLLQDAGPGAVVAMGSLGLQK